MGSTTNSVARTFLRDGAYVTDPVLLDGQATYTPGISERRGAAIRFLHSGIKNADAQTRTIQAIMATRQYDAFGNVTASSGVWHGPFGYAGGFGYQEDTTGLRLLGHRYYDPSTGRFLTRDPIKDGRNWYVYCESDPVNGVDPDGLLPLPLLIFLGAAAAVKMSTVITVAIARDDIVEDGRGDEIVWSCPDAHLEWRREQLPGALRRIWGVAEDAYSDLYITGPIGDIGGEEAKIAIEVGKRAWKLRELLN